MYNPLALLSPELLMALEKHGFTVFVRQSYPRGKDHMDTHTRETFLLTHYDNLPAAEEHLQHIAADHRKRLYRMQLPEEREELMTAAAHPNGYKVYVALLREKKWSGATRLQPKIKSYLQNNTSWKVKDGAIAADIFLQFGELMLKLESASGQLTLPLSEIERH